MSNEKSIESLSFIKQFLITPNDFSHENIASWNTTSINSALSLYTHPSLKTAVCTDQNIELICLGILLNPKHPTFDENDTLKEVIKNTSNFMSLEDELASLGGRNVIIATIDNETRIYHDATGLKSVFFIEKDNSVFIASHPSLLEHLELAVKNTELFNEFYQYKNSGSWPINIVPYHGVTQLLPNHFFDISSQESIRFWPRENSIQNLPLEKATSKMVPLLKGIMLSATKRFSCLMNLTGGYDSRAILAAGKGFLNDVEFTTILRNDSPSYDRTIAQKLSKKLSLNHHLLQANDSSLKSNLSQAELNNVLQNNVGGMYSDGAIQGIKTSYAINNRLGERLLLTGVITLKQCYNNDHLTIENVTAKDLANITGFSDNPIAEKGFSLWLDSLPTNLPIPILDLLYWEQRLGVWASCGMTYSEGINEAIPPMNCREFLELGLSTDKQYRVLPCKLIRDIIKKAAPELSSIAFNKNLASVMHDLSLKIPGRKLCKKILIKLTS